MADLRKLISLMGNKLTKSSDDLIEGGGPRLKSSTPDVLDSTDLSTTVKPQSPDIEDAIFREIQEEANKGGNMLKYAPHLGALGIGTGMVASQMGDGSQPPVSPIQQEISRQPQPTPVSNEEELEDEPKLSPDDIRRQPASVPQDQVPPEQQSVDPVTSSPDYLQLLKQAQESQRGDDLLTGLLRAATMTGAGIAGTKADLSGVESLEKLRGREIGNIKQQMETAGISRKLKSQERKEQSEIAKNDPDNEAAKALTSKLQKFMPGFPSGKSITEIEALTGIKAGTLIGHEENRRNAEIAAKRKLEESKIKSNEKAKKEQAKMNEKELKELRDINLVAVGVKRNPLTRKMVEVNNDVMNMEMKLDRALSGVTPMNEADAVDLSSTWSKILSGGVPAQSLIFETMPKGIRQQYANAVNFIASKPVASYYNKKTLKHMKDQLQVIKEVNTHNLGENTRKIFEPYAQLVKKYPDQRHWINAAHGDVIKFDDDGTLISTFKKTNTKGSPKGYTPKQEAMIQQLINNNEGLSRERAIRGLKSKGKL